MLTFIEGSILSYFRFYVVKGFMLFVRNLFFSKSFNSRPEKLEWKGLLLNFQWWYIRFIVSWSWILDLVLCLSSHLCCFVHVRLVKHRIPICSNHIWFKMPWRLWNLIFRLNGVILGVVFSRTNFWMSIQRKSPWLILTPNSTCGVEMKLFLWIIEGRTEFFLWIYLLFFCISKSSNFFRNSRVIFFC